MMSGNVVFSLDTEIAWGRIASLERFEYAQLYERTKSIIERLNDLFDKYRIPVTWAVVGGLIDSVESKEKNVINFYPELQNSRLRVNDEYFSHQLTYSELIDILKTSKVPHEIASHSYSHILFGDCSPDIAAHDIGINSDVFSRFNISLKSMVFPQNSIGHLNLFEQEGFTTYRGPDDTWYGHIRLEVLKKILRQIDYWLPITPNSSIPEHNGTLMNVPGNLLFRVPHRGLKRFQTPNVLYKKAIKGLQMAMKNKQTFHIWFHPFNFAYKEEEHFQAFEKVLSHCEELRSDNRIKIKTMQEFSSNYCHTSDVNT
jgi:hypothetical protein